VEAGCGGSWLLSSGFDWVLKILAFIICLIGCIWFLLVELIILFLILLNLFLFLLLGSFLLLLLFLLFVFFLSSLD